MALLLNLVCCLGALSSQNAPITTVQEPKPDEVEGRQRQVWEGVLKAVAKIEGVAMFFDVSPGNRPPEGYEVKLGRTGLEMLATLTIRSYKEIDGVQVFARDLDPKKRKLFRSHVNQLAEFLEGMPPELVTRILGSGLPISQIPDEKKWFLRFALGDYSTIGGGAALSNWDKTILRIRPAAAMTYTNPKTGRQHLSTLQAKPDPDTLSDAEIEAALKGASRLKEGKPFLKEPTGPLKYEEGKLLKLGDLLTEAQAKFDVYYLADGRLTDNYVFIKGTFDRAVFESCLRAIAQAPPAQAISLDPRDQKRGFEQMIGGSLKALEQSDLADTTESGVTMRDAINGKSLRLGDFVAGHTGNRQMLEKMGVSMNTNIKLVPAFRLQVLTLNERQNKDGKTERYWGGGVPILYAPIR
jgi:hypothetical protein